jgi:hypothetical protein
VGIFTPTIPRCILAVLSAEIKVESCSYILDTKGAILLTLSLTAIMSFSKSWILFIVFLLVGCGGDGGEAPQMQEFNATISGMNAEEPSISVTVPDSAEGVEAGTMSLTFTDSTQVLKNYMKTSVDSLQADQMVHVEAVKEGDQYVPSRVLILGN